jgi:hypothetical protein
MAYPILEYELNAAERYRRFVSLVMVSSMDEDIAHIKDLLGDNIRKSDVLSDYDSSVMLMLSETDKKDAVSAVKRYNSLFMNRLDLRFSVVTYPDDGVRADGLVETAYMRLAKAKSASFGSVVSQD